MCLSLPACPLPATSHEPLDSPIAGILLCLFRELESMIGKLPSASHITEFLYIHIESNIEDLG